MSSSCDGAPDAVETSLAPLHAPAAVGLAPKPPVDDPHQPDISRQIESEIPFLRRAVRRWHRDQADADDLVQDTLVRALANAHLYEPGSDLRAWLFTIMRNQFFARAAKANRFISMLRVFAETDHGAGGDRARPGSYYVMSPEPSGGCRASSASLSCSPALRVSPMRTSRRRWGSRSAPFAAIWHAAATG